ncbi:ABC transporter substrate-binding protein [Varunaivibrio sulfuroxidans]|uniref:Putative ABC transport system substrate-binding protein n=1 Tax=Varunaivibrio sulfuroxidans TaxID=1773489 RepID=A0A4R3J6N1_9PROT|nr:ABC transporter substrate-binding protein [Varunaivibrio sulfuroxidans]TCS61004.1 putative ABC transport system substrate-binding protein [Varunaivibrio sulfuroxidans]WES31590.1 ABC transporter substrate-binding protein [Varunaivibrio sulfuroxidans]
MKALRLGLLALMASIMPLAAQGAEKSVAITQIVAHPALDACRKGIKDALADAGYVAGKNLKWTYESAQGSPTTAAQVAQKFIGEAPDVIVAIATPSAQSVAANTKTIPLVFSAVTDPVGAKLVSNMEHPGKNITGVTDLSPIGAHMRLIKRIVPTVKRLGIVYNPGEANSVSLVNLVKSEAPKIGMSVVEAAAYKSSDVLDATRSLVGKVDAIYIPTDNTVVSAFEGVVKVAEEAKIPLFAADTDSVKRGAIAAAGFNYYDVGRQTGAMVARILNGEKPGDMAVEGVSKTELYLNLRAAAKMGVTVPTDIVKEAKDVIR